MTHEPAIDLIERPTGMMTAAGGAHTRTPWKKGIGRYDDGHTITSQTGAHIAFFQDQQDRDFALYFVNVHEGMIRMLEDCADKFDFLAKGSRAHDGTAACAAQFATTARAYAEILRKAGQIESAKQKN